MFCPMASMKSKQKDRKNYPGVEREIKRSIQVLCDTSDYGLAFNNDVDEIFNWWISNDSQANYKGMKQNYTIDYEE